MESMDPLTVVMKRVVIHGCLPRFSMLYRWWWGHPSLALCHFQNVSLLSYFPPFSTFTDPTSAAQEKAFKPILERNILHKSACGSLGGCNCYKNISICEVQCRQKRWPFLQLVYFPKVLERDNAVIENINCR